MTRMTELVGDCLESPHRFSTAASPTKVERILPRRASLESQRIPASRFFVVTQVSHARDELAY